MRFVLKILKPHVVDHAVLISLIVRKRKDFEKIGTISMLIVRSFEETTYGHVLRHVPTIVKKIDLAYDPVKRCERENKKKKVFNNHRNSIPSEARLRRPALPKIGSAGHTTSVGSSMETGYYS
jgi:hypothetical protein